MAIVALLRIAVLSPLTLLEAHLASIIDLNDCAYGHLARMTRRSGRATSTPCLAMSRLTLYLPRRPHGSQTIVNAGTRTSARVKRSRGIA